MARKQKTMTVTEVLDMEDGPKKKFLLCKMISQTKKHPKDQPLMELPCKDLEALYYKYRESRPSPKPPAEKNPTKIRWAKDIHKVLVGRKIVEVRYLTDEEKNDMGWFDSPAVLILDDGNWVMPMADDEGNNAGAMATSYATLETIPVI